ncbi:unnamed protein product [Brassicogethes aeneus]|uniref:Kinesin-like protein n=1 Tax=Brassicogethes aeneus TaxID=1431903 RepID=A0A9P0ATJ2_BRAAE|nr:unnamed protein product [Brassicogethes aeneus]
MAYFAKDNSQNVKVVVRLRPLSDGEYNRDAFLVVKCSSKKDISIKEKKYSFDHVFGPECSQLDVYECVVSPMIPDIISGYNCTIFAYGATGTGKTFTMTGGNTNSKQDWRTDPTAGIIPRSAINLFEELELIQNSKYTVRVSFLELYNEEVRDLLTDDDRVPPLNVFNDPNNKGSVWIQGVKEVTVCHRNDIFDLLEKGNLKRMFAPTLMNHNSSRSHTVFSMTVNISEISSSGRESIKSGKLNLVDLAGSENIARSGAKDIRAKELSNINKSLLTLGRVIHALSESKKPQHIPYRDSKLTRILQDSLGGRTKTCVIATLSPAHTAYDESLSTLEYAHRARDIKNCPEINEQVSAEQIEKDLNKVMEKLQKELNDAITQNNGFYIDTDDYNEMQEEISRDRSAMNDLDQHIGRYKKKINDLEQVKMLKLKGIDDLKESFETTKKKVELYDSHIRKMEGEIDKERHLCNLLETKQSELCEEAQSLLKTTREKVQSVDVLSVEAVQGYIISSKSEVISKEVAQTTKEYLNQISTHNSELVKSLSEKMESSNKTYCDFLERRNKLLKIHGVIRDYDYKEPSEDNSAVLRLAPLMKNMLENIEGFAAIYRETMENVEETLAKNHSREVQYFQEKCETILCNLNNNKKSTCETLLEISEKRRREFDEIIEDLNTFSGILNITNEKQLGPKSDLHTEFERVKQKDLNEIRGLVLRGFDDLKIRLDKNDNDAEKKVDAFYEIAQEVNKKIVKVTMDLINNLNEDIISLITKIRSVFEKKLTDITDTCKKFMGIIITAAKKFDATNESIKPHLANLLEKNDMLTTQLKSVAEDYPSVISSNLNNLIKSHEKNIKTTVENLQNEEISKFEQNILPVRHAGDTPCKSLMDREKLQISPFLKSLKREDIVKEYKPDPNDSINDSISILDNSSTE